MEYSGCINVCRAVILGLGANVRGRFGKPLDTLRQALTLLEQDGVVIKRISPLYRCEPFGLRGQPPFYNLIVLGEARHEAHALLHIIRRVEHVAGRRRGRDWGPRALDIDIIAMDGVTRRPVGLGRKGRGRSLHIWQKRGLVLPHPGVPERAFVLLPLCDIAPAWLFPFLQARARHLCARLSSRQRRQCRRIDGKSLSMRDGSGGS